jgi:hypothetical protein
MHGPTNIKLQLDLSRGLFPYALPSKILQQLATSPCMLHVAKIWHFLTFFFLWRLDPIPVPGLPLRDFAITFNGHTTLGRTPLDKWSSRRRDLYLTAHNCRKRKTSLPPEGFEPTFPVSERPQTHALHRAATKSGPCWHYHPLSPFIP